MSMNALEAYYRERARAPAAESYTRELLDGGTKKCAKKLGEEVVEAIIAAMTESGERLVAELADVEYHLVVLLMSRGLTFAMVEEELQRRRAKSGLEEKASRQS
ncbi:phosphoribosyl-ATP diphosphatase [Candidatus Kaiserbacteria bacterium]|nr:phosphoribosyl-ATP diphosphatase [Candidatus Kaiserbacteria bacterium]